MNRSGILGIILILIGVLGLSFLSPGMMGGPGRWGMMGGPGSEMAVVPLKESFGSNGERIYYTGSSERSGPIRFQGGPMWLAMHGGGCVNCHGVHGRGGVPVPMGTKLPPDIRYKLLTEKEPHAHGAGEGHPVYTDELIKRAITQGLNPAGKPLDSTMPRWQMTDEDLSDLIAYLKTLH